MSNQNISHLEWTEHTAPDGRKFFYNIKTKESTWEKPDVLKTAYELECDWTEYTSKEGRPYYYNNKTKKSQWDKPIAYEEMVERKRQKQQSNINPLTQANRSPINEMNKLNDLFVSQKLTMPNSMGIGVPSGTPTALGGPSGTPIPPIRPNPLQEVELKLREIEEKKKNLNIDPDKLTKEEAQKLFKDMLRRAGVTSTWKWEDCERVLHSEDMWKTIKTFQEKKDLFNEYVKDYKSRDREEHKLKKDKLKVKFRQMLEEDKSLTSDSKYSEIIMKFCQDERWRAIDERERDDIFQDYLDDLEKRENEERRIIRETKMRYFIKYLEDKKLPLTTKWKEICLNLKDDPSFNSMEKIDRLKTFIDYIIQIENIEKSEKDLNKKYTEYKNRENFREFLNELASRSEIHAKTKWKIFVHEQKLINNIFYLNLIGQEGSSPKDLFDDVIEVLKEDYKRNKGNLKKIFKTNSIKFSSETSFEQFDERLRSYYDYVSMKDEMKRTLHSHLIKKLKEKEKEHLKIQKKAWKKLESYMKRGKLDIDSASSIENVIKEIRVFNKFNIVSDEKISEIFNKIKDNLSKSDDDMTDEIKNDSSSESEVAKKKKSKRKKKNKKKKKMSDSSDTDEKITKKRKINENTSKLINYIPLSSNDNVNSEKEDGETST